MDLRWCQGRGCDLSKIKSSKVIDYLWDSFVRNAHCSISRGSWDELCRFNIHVETFSEKILRRQLKQIYFQLWRILSISHYDRILAEFSCCYYSNISANCIFVWGVLSKKSYCGSYWFKITFSVRFKISRDVYYYLSHYGVMFVLHIKLGRSHLETSFSERNFISGYSRRRNVTIQ